VASKPGLTWTADTLTANLNKAPGRAFGYLAKTTAYFSLRSEAFAKTQAKWTDRTGNARNTLSGSYSATLTGDTARFTVEIAHGMPYGLWLEVRFGQKYAIINRTVEVQGKQFFETANLLMAKMFGGS